MSQRPDPSSSRHPSTRLRRLRYHPAVRNLVQETRLGAADFILPLFVRPGRNLRLPIGSMPGHFQLSPDQLPAEIEEVHELGLGGVILFGIPDAKDSVGSDSTSDDGIVQQAIRVIRQSAVPTARDHRRLLLRIHRPRALRRGERSHRPARRR